MKPLHSEKSLLQEIEKHIRLLELDKYPAELYDPISYTLDLGGKRVRPLVCLMACDMFSGHYADAIFPAVGLELFHNFTLIHDDIMDKAPIRRGQPTVYIKWNPNTAILSGDVMMALAYKYMIKTPYPEVRRILGVFNKIAIEVCEGQQLDLNFEGQSAVSIDEYVEMIYLKTSVLLAGSMKIGAYIGGADESAANHLYEFGKHIGIAFQLKDDLLDVYSKEKDFGKQKGGDIIANKKTFLYLKALQLANEYQKEKLLDLYSESGEIDKDEKVHKVLAIYNKLDLQNVTRQEITRNMDLALSSLNKVKLGDNRKEAFLELSSKLMNRTK